MKKTVVYWKTKDQRRKAEVRRELGITCESVNGESEYNGDRERLIAYVEEGLIDVRMKEYEQEIRRKKVCFDPIESKSIDSKEVRCGRRKRKV